MQVRIGLLRQVQIPHKILLTQLLPVSCLLKLLKRVLMHRIEQAVTDFCRILLLPLLLFSDDQRFIDQACERLKESGRFGCSGSTDLLNSIKIPAACKDGEMPEQGLLGRGEQCVAPIESGL